MSIRYKFVPIYDNLNEEGEKVTGFYPKVVSRGTIGKERMFDDISRGSSSLRAELARSWMLMADYIEEKLEDGYDVCLNDFCTFGVSAKYRRVDRKRLCKLNCVMLYSHSISSVGERPAPRGGTTRPDERKITII